MLNSAEAIFCGLAFGGALMAGVPGLEPRTNEPESSVLPITPYPKGRTRGPINYPSGIAQMPLVEQGIALFQESPCIQKVAGSRACHLSRF